MNSTPLHQTDVPYSSFVLSVATVLGGSVAFGIFFALSAAYPHQPVIWWIPLVILLLGYFALLINYRRNRSETRQYNTSTDLLSLVNTAVFVIVVTDVLFLHFDLLQVITTLCEFFVVAFYLNYFIICLVLWLRPNYFAIISFVTAAFSLQYSVTHLPAPR